MCGAAFDSSLSSFASCMMGLGLYAEKEKEGAVHAFRLIALLQPEHLLSSCIACSNLCLEYFLLLPLGFSCKACGLWLN